MKDVAEIIEQETDHLLAFIRSKVSSEEDSWDIMQDVFLALCSRWNIGEALDNAASWLFSVARNKIIDSYRRRRRREIMLEDLHPFSESFDYSDLIDGRLDRPEDTDDREALRLVLIRVLEGLPVEQRDVFIQTEIEGRRFSEIADETGVPLNTLLSRKRYAVQKLTREMSEFLQKGDG